MPVRKFKSVEEMNTPVWRRQGDPALVRAIRAVWEIGRRTSRRRFPPGVHKYASIEAMDAEQSRWRNESQT